MQAVELLPYYGKAIKRAWEERFISRPPKISPDYYETVFMKFPEVQSVAKANKEGTWLHSRSSRRESAYNAEGRVFVRCHLARE